MDATNTVFHRNSIGALAISGDKPAGSNPGDGGDYDAFEAELAKLASDGPRAVDWTVVARSCEGILRNQAKDLKVANYYVLAQFRREGYRGLAAGLAVVHDIIAVHWDGMFPAPNRLSARVNQFKWLPSKVEALLSEHTPEAAEHQAIVDSGALLDDIDRLITEKAAQPDLGKLLDAEPTWDGSLRSLRSIIGNHERVALDKQEKAEARVRDQASTHAKADENTPPKTSPSEIPPTAPPQANQPQAAPPAGPTVAQAAAPQVAEVAVVQGADSQQIDDALNVAARGVKSVAKALLDLKLSDPRPYQMLRFANWIVLAKPPAHQNGKTMLMSPPADRIKALNDLVQAGKWSEALPQIETSVGNALFWLDAHRLAASALEGLGAEYADARRAVVDALAAVLRRLPILPDLVFQNGVPFADPLTRAWIAAEVLADGAGGAAATPWDQTANEARKLAGQGKIAAAADLFAQGRRQADGERARLQWELAQARFCAEIGNLTVAIPILEHLDDQIDAHRLESWEPDIAIDVSKQLLACYRKPSVTPVPGQPAPPRPPDDARAAREAKLRARLARLDVAEALRVMTG